MQQYIHCSKCKGIKGMMVKVGDGEYHHQREEDCVEERGRQREQAKALKARSDLVIAKPKLILPRGIIR